MWDPERWHLDRKRSETPPDDEPASRIDSVAENHAKRRSGDPRERIRKEQDGIVLSPQRRSFNSGCFVNVTQPPPRRPESPIGKSEVGRRENIKCYFLSSTDTRVDCIFIDYQTCIRLKESY